MLTFKIAFRNILLHKLRTTVIGLIIVFGTVLAILGNAFVDSIAVGMKQSLTHSVTGDLQIYSSEAKDKLSVFGNLDGSMPEIAHVNDYAKVKETLLARVPNIEKIIPMGVNFAMLSPGNLLDVKLEELRAAYYSKEGPGRRDRIETLKEHVKAVIRDIAEEHKAAGGYRDVLSSDDQILADAPKNLPKALSNEFWSDIDSRFEERIEFLANRIAPLIFDDNMLFFRYLGTLPEDFKKAFPLFEIVKGQEIPAGKRGFLFNDFVFENMVKHKIARRLDSIKKQMERQRQQIGATKELQDKVNANIAQAAEIYRQLAPVAARRLVPKLQELLKSTEKDVKELTKKFLAMDDSNFLERYKFFYEHIAPDIVLYKVQIGDVFPITAFTKTGYSSSVNMKVYGTYRFKNFEESSIAGDFSLMDMISFRELFGFMTDEKREQTRQLEKEMEIRDLGRADIEALFDAPAEVKSPAKSQPKSAVFSQSLGDFRNRRQAFMATHTREEMENGVFLNAAVLLKDPSKLSETMRQIDAVSKEAKLGIQSLNWRDASGMVGQLTTMVRITLYLLVFIIFGVASFIMMNSLLMATMERTREIGTIRAIGAQRRFIMRLFLQESFILSFIFGAAGVVLGAGIVKAIGSVGIPAQGDISKFFFSGERLHPSVDPIHIIVVFVCVTLVTLLSTQYPAWRAMKISPLEAMQKSD